MTNQRPDFVPEWMEWEIDDLISKCDFPYATWNPRYDSSTVTLHGEFTLPQLRDLVRLLEGGERSALSDSSEGERPGDGDTPGQTAAPDLAELQKRVLELLYSGACEEEDELAWHIARGLTEGGG